MSARHLLYVHSLLRGRTCFTVRFIALHTLCCMTTPSSLQRGQNRDAEALQNLPRPHSRTRNHRRFGAGFVAFAAAGSLVFTGLPAPAASATETHTARAAEATETTVTAEPMTQERIDAANNAYNDAAAIIEFVSMSDPEFLGPPTAEKTSEEIAYDAASPHYIRIAEWAQTHGISIDAVVANGDVVGANQPEYDAHLAGDDEKTAGWYRAMHRVMHENFPDAHVLLTHGNHDITTIMGEVLTEAREGLEPEWFFPRKEDDYVSNFHVTLNGIDFIGLDYNGLEPFGYVNQRNGYQQFLRDTLSSIEAQPDYDPAKPIFVYIHSGYAGSTLGGPFRGVWDLAGPDLFTILSDFPQAVLGSAHTHFSAHPEASIFQKDFTTYETGAMSYIYQDVPADFIGGGYFGGNQGDPVAGVSQKTVTFVSVLETGETIIRRFDVTQNRWIGMPWVVDTSNGTEGFLYTDEQRSTIAPWWGESAQITVTDLSESAGTIRFDHAFDDELVNHYRVAITDLTGNPVSFTANQVPDFGSNAPKSFNGSFRAFSRFYMAPDSMGFEITGLELATNYRVSVTAFDDFNNESEALTGVFRTTGVLEFPEFPEAPVPVTDDAFLSMAFEGDLTDEGSGAADAPAYTAVGNVTFVPTTRAGASGEVVRIAAGTSSYVDLGNRPEFDLGTDKDITISFWANVTTVTGYGAILSNKNWANWYRAGINIAPENRDTSKLEFTLGDGTNGVYATGGVENYLNSWHLMTVTVDRTRNIASTYMDGQLAKEASIAGVGSMTSGLNMLLGIDGSKSYGIGVELDDLQMWSSALTAEQVHGLYAGDNVSSERDALARALQYANELVEAMQIEAENGRVFDAELSAELGAAIDASTLVLNDAEADREALAAAYVALRGAVEAAESQDVQYSFEVVAVNGSVSPESGVVALAGSLELQLVAAEGYQVADAVIEVTGAQSHTVASDVLTVAGVTGPVRVLVEFAEVPVVEPPVDEDDDGDGTGDGDGTDEGDGTGDGDGSGDGDTGTDTGGGYTGETDTDTDTGTGSDATGDNLSTTGATPLTGLLIAGALAVTLGAGVLLLAYGRRLRTEN